MIGLTLLVYYLWICLAFYHGQPVMPSISMLSLIPMRTATSTVIIACWLLLQVALQILIPGREVQGSPLPDGSRLSYTMNGWRVWWLTWFVIAAAVALKIVRPSILADQSGPLLTTMNIVTWLFCGFLYVHGNRTRKPYERVTGNVVRDFWEGTALNPRIGNFDLKLFCEARPGLIAWVVLDLSFAAKQYETIGTVTTPV